MNLPKLRDETEVLIAATIGLIYAGFCLTVLYTLGMVEPLVYKQPSYSALGRCPDCHLEKHVSWDKCNGLTQQPWKDCMRAETEQEAK